MRQDGKAGGRGSGARVEASARDDFATDEGQKAC